MLPGRSPLGSFRLARVVCGATRRHPPCHRTLIHRPSKWGSNFAPMSMDISRACVSTKDPANTGTHVGHLWTASGTLLASVNFANESASGWQQVPLATPVAITANTTYVASYHTTAGRYALDEFYFDTSSFANPPLHALRDGEDGPNGLYKYGNNGFPTESFGASNYWVDVVFNTTLPPDTTPPSISAVSPSNSTISVSLSSVLTVTFNEAINPATISGSTFQLRNPSNTLVSAAVTYDAAMRTATLDPSATLAPLTHLYSNGKRWRPVGSKIPPAMPWGPIIAGRLPRLVPRPIKAQADRF